ncbi:MAG: C25 family cysteine peptidase [candidate division WOR-3 bacterium]
MKSYILVLIATILFLQIAQANVITKTFNFSEFDINFDQYNDYIIPNIRGLSYNSKVGEPCLPMGIYHVLIPATAEITSIEIEDLESSEIPGTYKVMPVPEYQPISLAKEPIIIANQDIYNSTSPYPEKIVNYIYTGDKSGYRIASFLLYPIQYLPVPGKLIFHQKINVKIYYQEGKIPPAVTLTPLQKSIFEQEIRSFIINPEDINRFGPPIKRLQNEVNYLIITTDVFSSAFRPLTNWRTKQGFYADILTTSYINTNYPGRDLAEKIRNAIIYYFQNRGLIFVVLGGDVAYVPKRGVYISYGGYTETSMPCDLYFSDLNRTWDCNNNNTFGEIPGDSVDFYPDVYVGRASISNETQVTTFVNKVLTFEKNPPTDYLKRILLPSVMLFSSYNWHGHIVNDSIAAITPTSWIDRSLIDPASTIPMRDSLNNGFEFCHVAAHGNEVGFYTQTSVAIYTVSSANSQTNGNKLFILNAIACHSGAFDYTSDCLAEAIMNNPNGGGVATIQNSRYGWGSPPDLGPSEWMDVKFYDFLFNKDSFRIGVAHARSKSIYTANALSSGVWRWCIYELNLFGDPAMPMWTDIPQTIIAQYPQVVPLGPSNLTIQVFNTGMSAINRALVSVQKGTEVYEQAYTDITGTAIIPISPQTPGKLYITITAQNLLPYEDSIIVQASGPYVAYLRATLNDSAIGNNDGIPNPGEEINMQTWVKNWGNMTATNVIGKLRSSDINVTIQDSLKTFGTILANDSAYTGLNGFRFTIAPTCTNGQRLNLQLVCKDNNDSAWTSTILVRVGTPVFVYRDKIICDSGIGNNNGRLDPNETADLIVKLGNIGYGNGYNVIGKLSSYDNRLLVLDSIGFYGTIIHETTSTNALDRFRLYASPQISPGTPVICSLKITADGNFQQMVGFSIIVGEFRQIDPIPDGPRIPVRYWAYDNIDTLYSEHPNYNWVEIKSIGTRLIYSHNDQVRNIPLPSGFGTLRFYGQTYNSISISVDGWIACGFDTTRAYSNTQLPSSAARPAMIAVNWDDYRESNTGGSGAVYWYYNATNGTLIVEWDSVSYYNASSTRDKFQVIFFDSTYTTPTGDNIFVFQYMTANLTNSSTIGIQDPTCTIGIQSLCNGSYHPASAPLVAGRAIKFTTAQPYSGISNYDIVDLKPRTDNLISYPNPFANQTTIAYHLGNPTKVKLGIFDIAGKLIKTLINKEQDKGSYKFQWNSKDDNGKKVAKGVYFIKLETDKTTEIKKLILIK